MPAHTLLDDRPAHSQPWAEDARAVAVAGASTAAWEDGGPPRRDDSSRPHASDLPAELPTSLVVAGREGTVVSHEEGLAYHVEARFFGPEGMAAGDGDRLTCLDSRRLRGACAPSCSRLHRRACA